MIVGSNIGNFFAYLYHIIFGRILTKAEYGDLAAFLAIIGMMGALLGFVGLVIVKFVASSDEKDIPSLMKWFFDRTLFFVSIISFIFFLLSHQLSELLNMQSNLIYLAPIMFMVMSIVFLLRSFAQGLLKFMSLVVINNINLMGRICFGIVFVYLGWSSFGAGLGLFFSTLLAGFLYYYVLRKFKMFSATAKIKVARDIISYSIPMFVASFSNTFLITIDLLMVKHFFAPEIAGEYSAISVIGKIIFYGTAPVGAVMFPMISSRFAKKQKVMPIFFLSIVFTLLIGAAVTIGYIVLPSLAIIPLYGESYLSIARYLGWYAIFITVYAAVNIIVNFYQSISKPRIGYLLLITAIAQSIAILMFHSTIIELIQSMIVVITATLIMLIIFMLRDKDVKLSHG